MNTTASSSAWLKIALARGVGLRTKRTVLRHLSPQDTLHASMAQLASVVSDVRARKFHEALRDVHVDIVRESAARMGQRVVTPEDETDADWLFEGNTDPPLALYVKGTLPGAATPRVAIVGTRRASGYGRDVAQSLASDLARHGVCVISGFALGIDGAAHRGAIQGSDQRDSVQVEGPATVAVLGCGIDVPYPRAHSDLRSAMHTSGVFVSEYPPGTTPERWHFPERNRLVASWADAVVVVEAPKKSGALITAHLALDAGRDVLVVPGSIRGDEHVGSHALLQSGAASLCTGVHDVLTALGRDPGEDQESLQAVSAPPDVDRYGSLWRSLDDSVAATADVLCTRTDLPAHTLRAALTHWELEGWVKRIPGLGYLRTHPS